MSRIAYVSSSVLPSRSANSVHVMQMASSLARLGHDVTLIAPRRVDRSVTLDGSDIWSFYGVERNFQIKISPWMRTPFGSIYYGVMAAAAVHKLRPDIVYARNLPAAWALSSLFRGPVSWEAHDVPSGRSFLMKMLFKQIAASDRLVGVVAISRALARDLAAAGIRQPILVAADGAPSNLATCPSRAEVVVGERLRVGYVGHLYAGKGMEMIARMASRCPWAEFHVVGGADADLAAWRQRLTGCDNVIFHGFVPPVKVRELLQSFDVAVAPFQSSIRTADGGGDIARWTSPLKIFEYMAAGLPIVCSRLPVLEEVLEAEVTALFCNAGDVKDWIVALKRLKGSQSLRQRIGSAARAKFLRDYTWEVRAARIHDFVKSRLESRYVS